ncbi:uncharacterized protein LOC142333309 [Lycorma delicatula]|uniref:uncharacterized protein LOC142333309 n=1 Tax=Lycorma delicatula TaxID=130591 RepID=UPI003F515B65
MYLRQIVRHHQTIIRTVKMLNDSLTWNILIFNQVCCVQFCLSLYGFFEREDMSSKIKYLLLMIPVFWCFTLFCWYGQQLTNAAISKEYDTAYVHEISCDCSWTNKPKWFQKNLCIVLLFSKHILQIMPLRLYALNFKNIMTVSIIILFVQQLFD